MFYSRSIIGSTHGYKIRSQRSWHDSGINSTLEMNIAEIRNEAIRIADTSQRRVVLNVCANMIKQFKRHERNCSCKYYQVLNEYVSLKMHKNRFFRRYENECDNPPPNSDINVILLEARTNYEKIENRIKELRTSKEEIKNEEAMEMMP